MKMDSRKIELNSSNYKCYLPIDIIAFSFAEGGAQGDGGALNIVSKEKRVFYLNLIWTDLSEEEVDLVCPILQECHVGPFCINKCIPNDWLYVYMGAGNHLFIHEVLRAKFEEQTKDMKYPCEYYREWLGTVINL